MSNMLPIRFMYKIHILNMVRGISHSDGNDTFYETESEALDKAREYVSSPTGSAMVIYKAVVLVRRTAPPIEIINL